VNCTHTIDRSRYENVMDDWTGETTIEWVERIEHTTVDLDVGRFQCTQCKLVMYYTGSWRKFYEEGISCPGSEGVKR